MSDLPEEAVQAAAKAMRQPGCIHSTSWVSCLECRARIALVAAAPILRADERRKAAELITAYEDLLGSVWLYIGWRYVTKQLTTEQKNLFADTVDAYWRRSDAFDGEEFRPVDRWWSDEGGRR